MRYCSLADLQLAIPAQTLIWLSDDNSLWGADLYVAVNKDVAGAQMRRISGTFFTKVFEGPFKDVGTWYRQMHEYVRGKHKEPKKTYAFYTTCPKCAKVYGKNYTVLLTQV